MSFLKLIKGSVTPFGLLNDEERKVQFYIGKEFMDGKIGIHPLENTATVWIYTYNLIKLIKDHGNQIIEY